MDGDPASAEAIALRTKAEVNIVRALQRPKRRNLVCIRAGHEAFYQRWFQPDAPRSWDLLLSFYIEQPDKLPPAADIVTTGGLSKLSAIKRIQDTDQAIFDGYEFIWFLDDDIDVRFEDIDVFFAILQRHGLSLAQPALSADSFNNWSITTADETCSLRHTNFVEVMMPAFSQDAFLRCIPTFDTSISGWGLDLVWPKILGLRGVAIVDSVIARHTKRADTADGPFYTYLQSIGIDPEAELAVLKRAYRLTADDILPAVLYRVPKPDTGIRELRCLYLDSIERTVVGGIYCDKPIEPWGTHTYNEAVRQKGRDWPSLAHTMIGLDRLHNVRQLVETVLNDGIPGDLIETGVWRGGACILMRAVLRAYGCVTRRVFVADSFQGLPPPDPKYPADDNDLHHTYLELAVSLEQVRDSFNRYGLLDDQVVFLKGWFKETLPAAPIESLAILRLDGDMYESTMDALTCLYAKLSAGGFCIVDDGNVPNCMAAIMDFRRANQIDDHIMNIDGWGFYWRKTRSPIDG